VQFKVRCWIENYVDTRISENGLNTAIYKALIDVDIVMATGVSYIPLHFADSENESVIPRWG
jgi:MscS family membrane protein